MQSVEFVCVEDVQKCDLATCFTTVHWRVEGNTNVRKTHSMRNEEKLGNLLNFDNFYQDQCSELQ